MTKYDTVRLWGSLQKIGWTVRVPSTLSGFITSPLNKTMTDEQINRAVHDRINQYLIDRTGIPLDINTDAVDFLIGAHSVLSSELSQVKEQLEKAEAVIEHYGDEENWSHDERDYSRQERTWHGSPMATTRPANIWREREKKFQGDERLDKVYDIIHDPKLNAVEVYAKIHKLLSTDKGENKTKEGQNEA